MSNPEPPPGREGPSTRNDPAPALSAVAEAASRLRYGAIQLTVHDGRIVQLDVTERTRFA